MIVVFDGKSVVYRLYYANPQRYLWEATREFLLTTVDRIGQNEDLDPPTAAVFAWENGRSFRHNIFAAYKAGRREIPLPLRTQLVEVQEKTSKLGGTGKLFHYCEVESFEGDDILGTCAYHAVLTGHECALVTADKDCDQLVGDGVFTYRPWESSPWGNHESVKNHWGLAPSQLPEYMALAGDPSDSIPGVPGVGDKKAMELMERYGSFEAIVKAGKEGKDKVASPVAKYEALARLCLQCATIRTDAFKVPPWRPA